MIDLKQIIMEFLDQRFEEVKAFTRRNWIFYDKQGNKIVNHGEHVFDILGKLKVTFHVHKNRQNGQKITLVADTAHVDINAVHAAYRISLRSIRLDQSDEQSMGVLINKHNQKSTLL